MKHTNINAIKAYANSHKKENKCTHSAALDIAAKHYGFENYKHASNIFSRHKSKLRIITKWKDANTGKSGKEYIDLELSRPPKNICNETELFQHGRLSYFRYVNNNCIIHQDSNFPSQFSARQYACYAARVYRFMDSTQLKPSNNPNIGFPKRNEMGEVKSYEGFDHTSNWLDPFTGDYYFTTEPYPSNLIPEEIKKEIIDSDLVRIVKIKKSSCGMHHIKRDSSSSTLLYIGGKNEQRLIELEAILNSFPAITEGEFAS